MGLGGGGVAGLGYQLQGLGFRVSGSGFTTAAGFAMVAVEAAAVGGVEFPALPPGGGGLRAGALRLSCAICFARNIGTCFGKVGVGDLGVRFGSWGFVKDLGALGLRIWGLTTHCPAGKAPRVFRRCLLDPPLVLVGGSGSDLGLGFGTWGRRKLPPNPESTPNHVISTPLTTPCPTSTAPRVSKWLMDPPLEVWSTNLSKRGSQP